MKVSVQLTKTFGLKRPAIEHIQTVVYCSPSDTSKLTTSLQRALHRLPPQPATRVCAWVDSILWTIRADADLYKRIGTRVSLPSLAVAQRMEVTVGKGRGGVALTLTLTLKDAPTIELSLNPSLLLPQLSLPLSELQPKEAQRRTRVPILFYRSASTRTVRKIESGVCMHCCCLLLPTRPNALLLPLYNTQRQLKT